MNSSTLILGIYDTAGRLADSSVSSVFSGQILRFPFEGTSTTPNMEGYLQDKDLFFNTATHTVIFAQNVEGLSFALTAIKRLLADQLRSVLIVSSLSLEPMLAMGLPEELEILHSRRTTGRFLLREEFDLEDLERLITS
ncbi:hypothetical protein [Microbispora bryophytorum]|uniref:hypothetical protein n=1 Tax=Microbispora bryophytorum TaxID=1460882 RepID=UPI0033E877CC